MNDVASRRTSLRDFANASSKSLASEEPEALQQDLQGAIEAFRSNVREQSLTAYRAADRLLRAGYKDLHDQILTAVPIDFIKEWRLRKNGWRTNLGVSFTAAMGSYRQFSNEIRRINGQGTLGRIFKKQGGRDFAEALGLAVAEQYQTSVRLNHLKPVPGTLVKPSKDNGSKGVIVFDHDGGIYELRTKQRYQDWNEAKQFLAESMENGYLVSNRFHLEELLQGPEGGIPHDIKFYTFYGKVGLALEIKRGEEDDRFCFYRDGEQVNTGKYLDRTFTGAGVPKEWEALARMVSSAVPLPFLRIDFYRTDKGLYMGEFTRWPGSFEDFNLEYDRYLGELFAKADARLYSDLIHGKQFTEYLKFSYPASSNLAR